jgi:solute carrier family 25 phosphate transporter 23/24/25/41
MPHFSVDSSALSPPSKPSTTVLSVPSPPAHPTPAPGESPLALTDWTAEPDESDQPPLTLTEKLQDIMVENSMVINTFIAGGLAGAASRTVVSPLERLKIIL